VLVQGSKQVGSILIERMTIASDWLTVKIYSKKNPIYMGFFLFMLARVILRLHLHHHQSYFV
jgi:hypothetical protein